MKFVSVLCVASGSHRVGRRGAAGEQDHSKDHDQPGNRDAGSGFPLYGNAFAEVMNQADPTLAITPRNTKGSNENIPLLEAGQLDLALVAGEPAYEAFIGKSRPPAHLKILTAIYSSPGLFVVRADSPYRTIHDLAGQKSLSAPRNRPADPVALCARRPRTETGRSFASGISIAPATAPRWCWTDGSPHCGAPASAGPALPRWPQARVAPASSRRMRRRSRGSGPGTAFSSR